MGLLYSSSQEIEVDARHYKQNTSNQSSQGFLHVHLFRGRDLPQGKQGSTETFSKWYATSSARCLSNIGFSVGKLLTQQGRGREGKGGGEGESSIVFQVPRHTIFPKQEE